MSKSLSEIYIQADGILAIYDQSSKLLQKRIVHQAEIFDLTQFKSQPKIHIWIWAYQFELPYYFTNTPSRYMVVNSEVTDHFLEYFWVREQQWCDIENAILDEVRDYWSEQKQQHYIDSKSQNIYMQDSIYITEGLMSRVIQSKDQACYIQHYLPDVIEPFKVSKLIGDPLRQHQNFIFYTKMQNICQAEKYPHAQQFAPYQQYFLHRGTEKIVDMQTEQEWTLKQLCLTYQDIEQQGLSYLCFEKMPDCQYYCEYEQWYGLDKCHTTTAHYQVKKGAVICTYYNVDVF